MNGVTYLANNSWVPKIEYVNPYSNGLPANLFDASSSINVTNKPYSDPLWGADINTPFNNSANVYDPLTSSLKSAYQILFGRVSTLTVNDQPQSQNNTQNPTYTVPPVTIPNPTYTPPVVTIPNPTYTPPVVTIPNPIIPVQNNGNSTIIPENNQPQAGNNNSQAGNVNQNPDNTSKSWGDPHFVLNLGNYSQHSFDFQGKNQSVYSMLESDSFSLKALFNNAGDAGSRLITDQDLAVKGTGINIVSHKNGTYEIYNYGNKISSDNAELKKLGISLNKEGNSLSVEYQGKKIVQNLKGSEIENRVSTGTNDRGLLTQLIGALDKDGSLDGITHINYDTNKDGKINDKDVLYYDKNKQMMVASQQSAVSAPVKTSFTDNSQTIASQFVDIMSSHKGDVKKVFDGAFKDADKISSSKDSRLNLSASDSFAVISAKTAMKKMLENFEKNNSSAKPEAVNAVSQWIESSTNQIQSSLYTANAAGFKENSGYSKSQWNELAGNSFITYDNFLLKKI